MIGLESVWNGVRIQRSKVDSRTARVPKIVRSTADPLTRKVRTVNNFCRVYPIARTKRKKPSESRPPPRVEQDSISGTHRSVPVSRRASALTGVPRRESSLGHRHRLVAATPIAPAYGMCGQARQEVTKARSQSGSGRQSKIGHPVSLAVRRARNGTEMERNRSFRLPNRLASIQAEITR